MQQFRASSAQFPSNLSCRKAYSGIRVPSKEVKIADMKNKSMSIFIQTNSPEMMISRNSPQLLEMGGMTNATILHFKYLPCDFL
jgi:hypothetical protein